ncbi:MAG TPA: dihydrodipicolinate synthase family protein [Candidatus Hydrogenedentes bacterium]|nr:dihydrodipicolinate synthase family protein [Candidatus Hydrogenedentota bacterium]HOC74383.1 dihydrodipicolinate synthase family protein [Candidatus Hydrogenedentota bacterium]HQL96224.1 dihydrodipicolinate synthase family protein [Candidatus Hydrogenedentota bacterium]
MDRLTGLIAATFTPMHPDGSVDLAPVPAMVEGLLRNGITALYVCGSTGEGPSLTTEERERVAEAFVAAAAGRLPVMVQVGHNSVEDARRLAAHAASIGADAISAVSPSYFIPEGVAALVETLGRVTDAAPDLPFYYYHIPRLSGVSLSPLAFLEAAPARMPSLAGVKFSCRDVEVMQACLAFDGGRFNILFGVDEMLLSGLAAGCHGAVGSTYNFLAPLYHEVMRRFAAGDLAGAQEHQLLAARMIAVILRRHANAGIKAAMTLAGMPCGPARLPLSPLTDAEIAGMRDELDALGFAEWSSRF